VQNMPLPLTVSCFSKIQIGFAFLVPAHPGSPGKMAVKRVCVCMFVDRPTCKYVSRVGCDIYGPDVPEPGAVLQTKILIEVHAEYMYYRVGQKTRGHRLMTILLSNLNRLQFFSLEDSLVNLQLNGY